MLIVNQGPVVQSRISANPGLNINQWLCISVCRVNFGTSENDIPIDPDKTSEEIFSSVSQQATNWKI